MPRGRRSKGRGGQKSSSPTPSAGSGSQGTRRSARLSRTPNHDSMSDISDLSQNPETGSTRSSTRRKRGPDSSTSSQVDQEESLSVADSQENTPMKRRRVRDDDTPESSQDGAPGETEVVASASAAASQTMVRNVRGRVAAAASVSAESRITVKLRVHEGGSSPDQSSAAVTPQPDNSRKRGRASSPDSNSSPALSDTSSGSGRKEKRSGRTVKRRKSGEGKVGSPDRSGVENGEVGAKKRGPSPGDRARANASRTTNRVFEDSPLKDVVLAMSAPSQPYENGSLSTGDGPVDVWEGWNDGTEAEDPLLNRVWRSSPMTTLPSSNRPINDVQLAGNSADAVTTGEFTVVSYNILSEAHVRRGVLGTRPCPNNCSRSRRHSLMMKELRFLDADVICLQEVDRDYFEGLLQEDMTKLGYSGRLMETSGSGEDHLATFYRNSRFKEVRNQLLQVKKVTDRVLKDSNLSRELQACIVQYLEASSPVQMEVLKCTSTGQLLCVVNLQAGEFERNDMRCVQIAATLRLLMEQGSKLNASNGHASGTPGGSTSLPSRWVVCGDLSSAPDSPSYQLCRDGYPDERTLRALQTERNISTPGTTELESLINLMWLAFQHPCSDMISCYHAVLGREPPMTAAVGQGSSCADYIWVNGASLIPQSVLLPRSSYLKRNKDCLPDAKLPSNHCSLACRIAFN